MHSVSKMRQVLRFARSRHRFSSMAAAAAGEEPSSSTVSAAPLLPSRHSRKRLPPVCTDSVMLKELTDEILRAPEGTLFTYQTDRDSASEAWDAADPTCQKVDFLVRGYAAQLPGTTWQRWVMTKDDRNSIIDPEDLEAVTHNLSQMEALLDRIWDEGHAYMTVRADRLTEKTERMAIDASDEILQLGSLYDDEEEETLQLAAGDFGETEEESDEQDEEGGFGSEFGVSEMEDEADQVDDLDEGERPFMNDFALPGPTVDTFQTILDAMACQPNSSFVSLERTRLFWTDILARHQVDGGDKNNTQPHTVTSVMSYNAPIRIVASLPYKNNDVITRDYGLALAFEAYDALTQSERCHVNSATFAYILQTVAKYMPPSRNKGNVAAGLFYVAQNEGCVDETVLQAYELANTPSNGPEFDAWSASCRGKKLGELPHSWRKFNKVRRHRKREATY